MLRIGQDSVVAVANSELTVVNSDNTRFCGCAMTTWAEDRWCCRIWKVVVWLCCYVMPATQRSVTVFVKSTLLVGLPLELGNPQKKPKLGSQASIAPEPNKALILGQSGE